MLLLVICNKEGRTVWDQPYLFQNFSDTCAHLLKGLRGKLVFAEVLQDLCIRASGDRSRTFLII